MFNFELDPKIKEFYYRYKKIQVDEHIVVIEGNNFYFQYISSSPGSMSGGPPNMSNTICRRLHSGPVEYLFNMKWHSESDIFKIIRLSAFF